MLYTDRIKNLTTWYPELTRVWFKTDDPKMPLKSVWINEAALRESGGDGEQAQGGAETADVVEDPLRGQCRVQVQRRRSSMAQPAVNLLPLSRSSRMRRRSCKHSEAASFSHDFGERGAGLGLLRCSHSEQCGCALPEPPTQTLKWSSHPTSIT
jgi:hypothetical protein